MRTLLNRLVVADMLPLCSFDRMIYVSPPDLDARRAILAIQLAKIPHTDDVQVDDLAFATEGYSGAEVVSLCQEGNIAGTRNNMPEYMIWADTCSLHSWLKRVDLSRTSGHAQRSS